MKNKIKHKGSPSLGKLNLCFCFAMAISLEIWLKEQNWNRLEKFSTFVFETLFYEPYLPRYGRLSDLDLDLVHRVGEIVQQAGDKYLSKQMKITAAVFQPKQKTITEVKVS